MHVFGEIWRDHATRMAGAWDALVRGDDWVLLPGDLSWARDLAEAEPDLAWIGARPGRKLLLRGNHDSWWGSRAKVRKALPDSCELLQHDSFELAGWVVVGARGWTAPGDPRAQPSDERVYERELERLKMSIADADRRFPETLPRLAMSHYPPLLVGQSSTPVVELLRAGRVRQCVYGHLHGDDHALAVDGVVDGILYRFVAADAVDFAPLLLAGADEVDHLG